MNKKYPDIYEKGIELFIKESELDREDAEELFDEYIENIGLMVSQLEEMMKLGDLDGFKMKIHQLKGVSGNLRVKEIYEDCKKAEELIINGFSNEINEIMKDIKKLGI